MSVPPTIRPGVHPTYSGTMEKKGEVLSHSRSPATVLVVTRCCYQGIAFIEGKWKHRLFFLENGILSWRVSLSPRISLHSHHLWGYSQDQMNSAQVGSLHLKGAEVNVTAAGTLRCHTDWFRWSGEVERQHDLHAHQG